MIFFIIFGQNHVHPETGEKMKDYYVEVEAPNRAEAYDKTRARFGLRWSLMYEEKQFEASFYPKGNYDLELVNGLSVDEMFERVLKRERNDKVRKIDDGCS